MTDSVVRLVPEEERGRGYGAKDLQAAHLENVSKFYGRMHPDVKAIAIQAARLTVQAEQATQLALLEVRRVAGDKTKDVMEMAKREAASQLASELHRAQTEKAEAERIAKEELRKVGAERVTPAAPVVETKVETANPETEEPSLTERLGQVAAESGVAVQPEARPRKRSR